ncbi:hypothetical protein VB713_08505 [Anabaena cylindrica UHCC 0172]|uniref:hypothetical protein n=1 Tax=Anabaena cylindrica TaxID=1165 RepID=UPI002B1F10D6|nr:hypothetical protein [Anabaena cylindrica]MEA5551017.1 hypothetical protein [Anabaena cylindrica UHCC 0172]
MNKTNPNLKKQQKAGNISLYKLHEDELSQVTGGSLSGFVKYSNVTLKRGLV